MATARRTGSNENVATYGGATRDYDTDLAGWEAATDINISATGTSTTEVLECYDDAASFDDGVTISGATTDTDFFRMIRPASGQGHNGTPTSGVFFSRTTAGYMANIAENNFHIQDLIGSSNFSSASSYYVWVAGSTGGACELVGLLAVDSTNTHGSGVLRGIYFNNNTDQIAALCLVHNIENHGFYFIPNSAGRTNYAYNCISTNNGTGFREDTSTGSIVLKNCLADSNSTDYTGGDLTATNCASSDATSPDATRRNKTFTFVSAAGDDFHLAAGDAGAKDDGTDLSADGVFAFDDDIDGDLFDTWDIGFDEPDPPAGDQTISITDTGAGADTPTIAATTPLAETGTGTAISTIAAALALAETGTGTDTPTTAVTQALTDAGAGTDALSSTANAPVTDPALGVDGPAIDALVPLTDTGTGADPVTVTVGTILKSVTDTGAGVDAVTVGVLVPIAETGTEAEALTIAAALAVSDTGAGADPISALILQALADAGTGTDTLSSSANAPVTDPALGVDGPSIDALVPLPETATGTDTPTVTQDTATISVTDTGTGTDTPSISVAMLLAETALGADSPTVAALITLADAATGTDAVDVPAFTIPLPDTGAGLDAVTQVLVSLSVADTGTGTDVVTTTTPAVIANISVSLAQRSITVTLATRTAAVSLLGGSQS